MTSRSGVWGWGRERLWRGPGECGKEPCLTHQGLDSPRLPVSHPQTRPNQPTGPQAHAASHTGTHQHTDMHQHTGTNTHRHLPRHTQAEPQSDTGTQGRTPRDTADTRVTPTRKPTSVMTRAHIHTHTHTHTHTHSQFTVSSPSPLEINPHWNRHAHLDACTSYIFDPDQVVPPPPRPDLPVQAQGTLPQKGSTEKKSHPWRSTSVPSEPSPPANLSLSTCAQNSQGVADGVPQPNLLPLPFPSPRPASSTHPPSLCSPSPPAAPPPFRVCFRPCISSSVLN